MPFSRSRINCCTNCVHIEIANLLAGASERASERVKQNTLKQYLSNITTSQWNVLDCRTNHITFGHRDDVRLQEQSFVERKKCVAVQNKNFIKQIKTYHAITGINDRTSQCTFRLYMYRHVLNRKRFEKKIARHKQTNKQTKKKSTYDIARRPRRGKRQHGLHGNVQTGHIECFKPIGLAVRSNVNSYVVVRVWRVVLHNLGGVLAILGRVERRLGLYSNASTIKQQNNNNRNEIRQI
jgi:hypothetical protein